MTPTSSGKPLVSFAIPCYNHERYIGETLDSCLAQTYPNIEIVVVDDASTDGSRRIIEDYVRRFPDRIRADFNDRNCGQALTARKAVGLTRGDLIAGIGSDDLCLPHRIAAGVDLLLSNPALGAVFSRVQIIDGDGLPVSSSIEETFNASIENVRWRLLAGNCLCGPSVLARGELIRRHRPNAALRYVEDFDQWLRILDTHEIHRDDDVWIKYRQHASNLSIFTAETAPLAPYYETAICIIRALQRWPIDKLFTLESPGGGTERERELAQCHARLAEHCLMMDQASFGRPYLYSQEAYRQLVQAVELDADNQLAAALLPEAWRRLGDTGRAAGGKPTSFADWKQAGANATLDLAPPATVDERSIAFRAWQNKCQLRDIDGEHFAARMRTQWRRRARFALLLDGSDAPTLEETLGSLRNQIYSDWVAAIIGGQVEEAPRLTSLAATISAVAAVAALGRSDFGDWVLLVPRGAQLEPHALFALADAIECNPQWQLVYADDAPADGAPRFKPDFDRVLLAGADYLGIVAVAAPLLEAMAADARPAAGLGCALAWQIAGSMGDAAIGHVADLLFRLDAGTAAAPMDLLRACVASHFERQRQPVHLLDGPRPATTWSLPGPSEPLPPITLLPLAMSAGERDAVVAATAYPGLRSLPPAAAEPQALAAALAAAEDDIVLVLRPGLAPAAREWLQTLASTLLGWQAAAAAPAVLAGNAVEDAGYALGIGGSLGPALPATRYGEGGDTLGRAALPHRAAALAGSCLLLSRSALVAAGGLDATYASIGGCLADACLKLHRAGRTLVWTPIATLRRMSPPKAEAAEPPQAFVERWLPTLAHDPFWNRNLSLQSGAGLAETDLVPRWNPDRRDVLRVLALPLPPSGQAEYRVTAPLRMLDNLGLAQVTSACEPHIGKERAPTPVELERLAPDAIYAQAAFDDVRLQGLIHAARHNPGILRVFSLDDRVTDVPDYNASRRGLPPEKVAERMRLALSASQRLVVSTEPLAELYRNEIDDIRIVPNRLEKALWDAVPTPARPGGKKPRVGWAGAIQHQGDLAIIAPIIEALADEVDWVFFGMIPAGCEKFIAEFHAPVKPYAAYPAKLGSLALDLALAPLEINLFNEAKSNLRLLEYGFFGWPVIASDIVPYQTDGAPVCRVANRPQAWLTAIRERLADRAALRSEGERLRDWVRARYLLEDWPDDWLSALTPGGTPPPAPRARPPEIVADAAPKDVQGGWRPEARDGLPRVLAYAQTTKLHDYRAASPLRALRDAGLAHTMLVGKPESNVVSYLPSAEVARLAPDASYWHFIIDDLRLEGLQRCAHDFPELLRVYSLDDRIGDLPPSHPQAATFPGTLLDSRIREALRQCQRLIVTTQPLADLYGSLVESVQLIPNRLEKALWQDIARPAKTPRQRPRVGWAGAQQHQGDLALLAETIAALADEVDWIFFGLMPPGSEAHVREFHAPVGFRDYPAKLASLDLDIALAPLEINLFNEAKSNLRLLDYGYLGWPVVCTDILPYRTDAPPVTRVANTTAAWTRAIRELAADPDAARRQGEALRQWVCRGYLLEDRLDDWLRALT